MFKLRKRPLYIKGPTRKTKASKSVKKNVKVVFHHFVSFHHRLSLSSLKSSLRSERSMKLGCQLEPVCTVLDFTARFLKKNMEKIRRLRGVFFCFIVSLFLLCTYLPSRLWTSLILYSVCVSFKDIHCSYPCFFKLCHLSHRFSLMFFPVSPFREASSNKCIASSNKCLTSSNNVCY